MVLYIKLRLIQIDKAVRAGCSNLLRPFFANLVRHEDKPEISEKQHVESGGGIRWLPYIYCFQIIQFWGEIPWLPHLLFPNNPSLGKNPLTPVHLMFPNNPVLGRNQLTIPHLLFPSRYIIQLWGGISWLPLIYCFQVTQLWGRIRRFRQESLH